jgi:hypothetical protein
MNIPHLGSRAESDAALERFRMNIPHLGSRAESDAALERFRMNIPHLGSRAESDAALEVCCTTYSLMTIDDAGDPLRQRLVAPAQENRSGLAIRAG